MEKPYLNLHFKYHDFFLRNHKDMKTSSYGFFMSERKTVFTLKYELF